MHYASNTPISRPINLGLESEVDFGGIQWSGSQGFFFKTNTELPPFQEPETWHVTM